MSFWSKIKSKAKVVIGAVALAVAGAGAGYFMWEKIGYDGNIQEFSTPLDRAIFVGDTGQPGLIRDAMVQAIGAYGPNYLTLVGDVGYPSGVHNDPDFNVFIGPFLGPWKVNLLGGNHTQYSASKSERNYLAANSDRLGAEFGNYYRGEIYSNVCLGFAESTVYDVRISEPGMLGRQEKFLRRFFDDPRCAKKLRILTAHHTVYTYGPHMNDTRDDWREFVLSLPIQFLVSGHDHLIAYSVHRGKEFLVAGSGSKISKCREQPNPPGFCISKPGYWKFENNAFQPVVVE